MGTPTLVKLDEAGNLIKFKAHLVAKAYSQIPGQDFDQTFAPVMHLDSLRNMIVITSIHNLDMSVLDVKSAYLHGDLEETIYMQQPEGFSDGSPCVCLLIHSLYGLKQSGRAWNKMLDAHLKSLGYCQLNANHCIYIQQSSQGAYDIFSTWVDDFALFCMKGRMPQNKKEIGEKWEITDQGEDPCIIVGIQIHWERNLHQITIHQGAYIQRILECFGMANSDTVMTPMDHSIQLVPMMDNNVFEHLSEIPLSRPIPTHSDHPA